MEYGIFNHILSLVNIALKKSIFDLQYFRMILKKQKMIAIEPSLVNKKPRLLGQFFGHSASL